MKNQTNPNFHHFLGITGDEVEEGGNEESILFNQFCWYHMQFSLMKMHGGNTFTDF